jgi:hypothetical protein
VVEVVEVGRWNFGRRLAQALAAFFSDAVSVAPPGPIWVVALTPCSVRQLRYAANAAVFAVPPPTPPPGPACAPAGRRLAHAVIAFVNAALRAGRAGRAVVELPPSVVPVGGAPPGAPAPPPPGGAPPPVGRVTPFFFRQAVYFASAALEAPVAAAPAVPAVVEVVEAVVVELVLDAEPLLPPQAAAARAVVMRSATSAPR